MISRVVATPIPGERELPVEGRAGGFNPALLDAILPAARTEAALEALTHPRVLLVTTGQQPGLLTGPLYTIYKGLSAAVVARQLSERWERPVVPVFWIAGDDHDFEEANHAAWLTAEGQVRKAVLRKRAGDAPLLPMYKERLGDDINPVLELLASDIPESGSRDQVLAWLASHYTPDATLAGSFGGALAELLAPLGILCLDSTHLSVKRNAIRHIIRALGVSRALNSDLAARDKELRQAGHDAGVGVGDEATLVMLEASQGRDRLIHDGDGFITRRSGERFTLAELERLGAESPGRFSGNVLLRPVIESAILPTVAYVAGPGELRYLALTQPVYERLRVPQQLPVPRWSGLLVESRVDRTLERFGAGLEDLQRDDHALESAIARRHLPEEAVLALDRVRTTIRREYGLLESLTEDIDPTMIEPVRKTARHGISEADRLEERLVQHQKARHETELSQVARARASIRPLGKPQERVLTIAPFLARHGFQLLEDLSAAIADWYGAALVGGGSPS